MYRKVRTNGKGNIAKKKKSYTIHDRNKTNQVLTVLLMREMHKAHKRRMRLKNKAKGKLFRNPIKIAAVALKV